MAGRKIPDSAQYCIDELQRRGHLVSIATGRIQVDAMRFAEQARITNVVADGGHSITIDGNLVSMIWYESRNVYSIFRIP